jgi:hypothetical protein
MTTHSARSASPEPACGVKGAKTTPVASERTSDALRGAERPIDRFARLLADIRRTHPVTALMLSAEYVRCARADREAWLAAHLGKLEAEWRA